jgi:hypothetical protein
MRNRGRQVHQRRDHQLGDLIVQFSSESRPATFANLQQMLNQRLCFGEFAFQFVWQGSSQSAMRCTNIRQTLGMRPCVRGSLRREIDPTAAETQNVLDRVFAGYWLAAEMGLTEILTVDVSDFSRYRLPRGKAFTFL